MERLLPKRVVLTLADETVRIFGADCQRVLATPVLNTVTIKAGFDGLTSNVTFDDVKGILYDGQLERLVHDTDHGGLRIEYPQRLARVELDLSDGSLVYRFGGSVNPIMVEEVQMLDLS